MEEVCFGPTNITVIESQLLFIDMLTEIITQVVIRVTQDPSNRYPTIHSSTHYIMIIYSV